MIAFLIKWKGSEKIAKYIGNSLKLDSNLFNAKTFEQIIYAQKFLDLHKAKKEMFTIAQVEINEIPNKNDVFVKHIEVILKK